MTDPHQMTTKRSVALLKENQLLKEQLRISKQHTSMLKCEKKILLNLLREKKIFFNTTPIIQPSTDASRIDNNTDLSSVENKIVFEKLEQRIKENLFSTFKPKFVKERDEILQKAKIVANQPNRRHQLSTKPFSTDNTIDNSDSISSSNKRKRNKKSLMVDEGDSPVAIKRNPKVSYDIEGNPILPLQLGILTINNLGSVMWEKPLFHSKRYIWPVGFESTRPYASTIYADKQTIYHSKIIDGGEVPRFDVIAEDVPDKVFSSSTPTGAWSAVIKTANELRGKDGSNSASGPDYFGFSNPIVGRLIEELDGAEKCENYMGVTRGFSISHSQNSINSARIRRRVPKTKDDNSLLTSISASSSQLSFDMIEPSSTAEEVFNNDKITIPIEHVQQSPFTVEI